MVAKMKVEKTIKELDLDLRIKLLTISDLVGKSVKYKKRDVDFYSKLSQLLGEAQSILSDKYRGKSEET
jgi:hypothetical protein